MYFKFKFKFFERNKKYVGISSKYNLNKFYNKLIIYNN